MNIVPKALQQVWDWKNSIYGETQHLSTEDALRKILQEAEQTAHALGFPPAGEAPPQYGVLAEKPAPYTLRK